MSNILLLCTDKKIDDNFLAQSKAEIEYFGQKSLSYLKDYSAKIKIDCEEPINFVYKLDTPIYFELEEDNYQVEEIYQSSVKLLSWLNITIKNLIAENIGIYLLKTNCENNCADILYIQEVPLSFLTAREVVFEEQVLYKITN